LAPRGCQLILGAGVSSAQRAGLVRRLAASLGVSVFRVSMLGVAAPLGAGGLLGVEAVCGFVGGFCCGARRLVGSNV